MRYTVTPFQAKDHRPEPFLGQRVCLPEMAGYSQAARDALENPLLSFDAAATFVAAMAWFSNGYDEKLSPAHWGVFTARTLEAMFWRLADLLEETPRWGIQAPGQPADIDRIVIHCEGAAMHNLGRDFGANILHPRALNPKGEDYTVIEMPDVDREFLLDADRGNARVASFWQPIELGMVIQAMAAFDVMRFTDKKDELGKPLRFHVDVPLLLREGHLAAMGKLFGPSFTAGVDAVLLDASAPMASSLRNPARL